MLFLATENQCSDVKTLKVIGFEDGSESQVNI